MNYKFTPRFRYTLSLFSYFELRTKRANNILENRVNLNSARTGLRLLLSSISKDTMKVGVQAYTCHTVFQAIFKAGHIPVFIDINKNFQLDLDDLNGKKIDVLIVTHTFGFPTGIEKIRKLPDGIIIIEDAAHAFLSKSNDAFIGQLADASIFSTGLGKFPSVGAGGFCLINRPESFPYFEDEYGQLKKDSLLSAYFSFFKTVLFSILMKPPFYGLITYPLGKRLDSKLDFVDKYTFKERLPMKWTHRVFDTNFDKFKGELNKQKGNANYLNSLITDEGALTNTLEGEPNYYIYPVLKKNRDQLFDELLKNNIEPGKHFSKSLTWAKEFGYKEGDCPETEVIINQVLTLPIHSGVSEHTLRKMASVVNRYD